MQLMENFPSARAFYFKRAWERRTEFRRRQKKFLDQVDSIINNPDKPFNNSQGGSLSDSSSSSSSHTEEGKHNGHESIVSLSSTVKGINKKIDHINPFFIDFCKNRELLQDYSSDFLEILSEDEK